MAGIGVILNRNAGRKGLPFRGNIGKKLAFVLGDPNSLKETEEISEIDQVISSFREREIDILGISGGDGSNHYVLDACERIYGHDPFPKIAFLCGGTHNAHAMSIGVRGSPEKLLQNILRKYHRRDPFVVTHRVLMKVDDGVRVHHGFSMAGGFMYRFYEEMVSHQDDSPAHVAKRLALWIGSFAVGGLRIRKLFRLERAHVWVGKEPLDDWDEMNAFSASSMEKLGLGFTPYPLASQTPTTFQVGVLRINPYVWIKFMWNFKNGTIPVHQDLFIDIADRFVVETEAPISYVFDGELFDGTNRVQISTARKLELIVS